MQKLQLLICSMALMVFFTSCNNDAGNERSNTDFVSIPSQESGLIFNNVLDETILRSLFNYINGYSGGGVAIGDINNDGLQDVYLTGNMTSSRLFLNKGHFKFEDITEKSGTGTENWSTAVTMADINNDSWLDIYVCKAYVGEPEVRKNQLFINNKDGSFTDKAEELGVADENYSIASSFFDYDKDGDLDLFVGNHPRYRAVSLQTHFDYWNNPVLEFSNRLYRNDGDHFTEVTKQAGVLAYGFTLGVSTSDFNHDGYPDIFVTVDHDEPDIIYRNNGNGTFTNIIKTSINQSSLSSMGIDAGDVNHDIFPDFIVAEMLSEDHYREKVNMSMQSVDRFHYLTDTMGYKYYQMHNFLHLNNGDESFSDISQLSGVSKSDWSWATLFMDYDNDSWQDLYITNGLYKEVFNKDKRKQLDEVMHSLGGDMTKMNAVADEYSRKATQTKIKNYLFKNTGDLLFEKVGNQSGLGDLTISTGAAYGDLDNDGDLDLVVNNIGDESLLYENKIGQSGNYLRLAFENVKEMNALGSKVFLYYDNDIQRGELLTTRGFQSSCEPFIHFGLSAITHVDKMVVVWPDDKYQVFSDVKVNQTIKLSYSNAAGQYDYKNDFRSDRLIKETDPTEMNIAYVQKENIFNDYDIQVLLPHKMSEYGPFSIVGDVNGDGKDDIYIGSPAGQASVLYIQEDNGKFRKSSRQVFEDHKEFEDGQALFFDADGDDDSDLLVSSTGYELPGKNNEYVPRLYLNNGKGDFKYNSAAISDYNNPSSCVKSADFDKDGDLDVFIGGRLTPRRYPLPGTSALFINDGQGRFINKIDDLAPGLKNFGMVKDALWNDFNDDGQMDLMIVGEWTPISIWLNENGIFVNRSERFFDKELKGWWNKIVIADLDEDGNDDYILGNLGLNYKYKASDEKPFMVYAKDFDQSGSNDIVLGTYYGDVVYPVRGKSCSSEQIPSLGNEFETFEKFALADINQVYGKGLDDALKYEANYFKSVILYKEMDGKFTVVDLPNEAQVSPVNDIIIKDIDKDGDKDILLGGNLYQSEIETGRADSGCGLVLINEDKRNFNALKVYESGLKIRGDVKSLTPFKIGYREFVLVGNNKNKVQILEF